MPAQPSETIERLPNRIQAGKGSLQRALLLC
jgi:hypothetical protein